MDLFCNLLHFAFKLSLHECLTLVQSLNINAQGKKKKMKETVGVKRRKNIARGNCNNKKKTFRKLGEYVKKK